MIKEADIHSMRNCTTHATATRVILINGFDTYQKETPIKKSDNSVSVIIDKEYWRSF